MFFNQSEIGIDGMTVLFEIIISISYLQKGERGKRTFGVLLDEALKFFNGLMKIFLPKMGPSDPVLGFITIRTRGMGFQESLKLNQCLIKSLFPIGDPSEKVKRLLFL